MDLLQFVLSLLTAGSLSDLVSRVCLGLVPMTCLVSEGGKLVYCRLCEDGNASNGYSVYDV